MPIANEDFWRLRNIVPVSTTPYGVTQNGFYLIDASGGARTVNLPDISLTDAFFCAFKKTDINSNYVTITPFGTQKIDGAASILLRYQWDVVLLGSFNGNWYIADPFGMVTQALNRANDSNFTYFNPASSKDYVEISTTAYTLVSTFIYRGSAVWTPGRAWIVCSRSGTSGTSYIRLWDATNSLQIFEYAYTHEARTLDLYTSIANIPLNESIFEIQLRRSASNAGAPRIHALGLYPV